MSDALEQKANQAKINPKLLPAIDRLLIAGIKIGPNGKSAAINKVLQLVPEWNRGDCWRRIRQLRNNSELSAPVGGSACDRLQRPESTASLVRRPSRPWTAADDDRLLNSAGYEPVRKIAQRLDRSVAAVRFRLGALGMSAKVSDGWSQRSLRKLLRVSPTKLRSFIGKGLLRARDVRVSASSLKAFCDTNRASLESVVTERIAAALAKREEAYSWERAAGLLGVTVPEVQNLIGGGQLKVFDPFVTDRSFEEFCKKHGNEINLSLLDAPTAKWLVNEYGVPQPDSKGAVTSRAQKHALTVRACQCGKKIAGNAYFRHVRSCPAAINASVRRSSSGGSGTQQISA
jgi:hypothetical protein